MKMPSNTGGGGSAQLVGAPTVMGHHDRHHDKPGLAEVLAMLAQFGPTAQVGQQMDQEKLSQMQQAHQYAQAHGYPNLDAMQLGQQGEHQQQIEQHQTDQERRLDEAQQQQMELHKDAQFIDMSRLATDPMMAQPQNANILAQVRKRMGLPDAVPTSPTPDPRILKHAPTH